MQTISVRNDQDQVAHFSVTGPADPVASILLQRVARGELERTTLDDTSAPRGRSGGFPVAELHEGVRDEKGDLLKSVHGGGLDPDAAGDALGRPSGSGISAEQSTADAKVAVEAVVTMSENADRHGIKLSPTTVAAAASALPADELGDLDDDDSADPTALKGAELDKALEVAGLSKTGTVKEKRARLAEHSQS